MVSKLCVKQGDRVEKDQVLAVIEAMKMETAITARTAGTVKAVRIKEGQPVKARELLMELEVAPQKLKEIPRGSAVRRSLSSFPAHLAVLDCHYGDLYT